MAAPKDSTEVESKAEGEASPEGRPEEKRSQDPSPAGRTSEGTYSPARLIEQLAERGFGVVEGFVDAGLLQELGHCARRELAAVRMSGSSLKCAAISFPG